MKIAIGSLLGLIAAVIVAAICVSYSSKKVAKG